MSTHNQPNRNQSRGLVWMLVALAVLVGVALTFYLLTPTGGQTAVESAAASATAQVATRAQPSPSVPAASQAVMPPTLSAAPASAAQTPSLLVSDGDLPPPDQAAKAARKTVSKVEAEFFAIEVVQCKASGTAIGCDLKITNNGDDRNLAIDSGRLYDNFGNRYELSARRVANVSGWNWIKLFRNTPVKAWIEFNKDSQQASESITAMELKFAAEPRGFEIQFRNLPLASAGPK